MQLLAGKHPKCKLVYGSSPCRGELIRSASDVNPLDFLPLLFKSSAQYSFFLVVRRQHSLCVPGNEAHHTAVLTNQAT